jgi:PD-(D/E)XK nuclease superfamily protein
MRAASASKTAAGGIENRFYRGQADLFAAHSPDTRQVYVLAVDEVPETDVWLRLTPARNNNQYGIRLAEDHTLAAWAARQQIAA